MHLVLDHMSGICRLCIVIFIQVHLAECTTNPFFQAIKVDAGQNAVLKCQSTKNETVFWGLYSSTLGETLQVASFGSVYTGFNQRFSLHGNNLLIVDAQVSDGGLYECIEDNGASRIKHLVHLSVVGIASDSVARLHPEDDTTQRFQTTVTDLETSLALTSMHNISTSSIIRSADELVDYVHVFVLTSWIRETAVTSSLFIAAILALIAYCVYSRRYRVKPVVEGVIMQLLLGDSAGDEKFDSAMRFKPAVLPVELMELVVLKSVSQLFNVIGVQPTRRPRAEVFALVTVLSVCRDWWRVGSSRRQLILRHFESCQRLPVFLLKAVVGMREWQRSIPQQHHEANCAALKSVAEVCHHWCTTIMPLSQLDRRLLRRVFRSRRYPQMLAVLPSKSDVWCAAQLAGRVFTASYISRSIQVFEDSGSFKRLAVIVIPDADITDIVACHQTRRLFVADLRRIVWQVDVEPGYKVDALLRMDYSPWSLSLRSQRLMVTPHGGDSVYIYDVKQQPLGKSPNEVGITVSSCRIVKMQTIKDVVHAAELTSGTFLVCGHTYVSDNDRMNALVKVDRRGDVEERYSGPEQQGWLQHLAVHSDGRVLVACTQDSRVVLLDTKLRYDRVLLGDRYLPLIDKPVRLCYSERTGRLIVVLNGRNGVHIYDWR